MVVYYVLCEHCELLLFVIFYPLSTSLIIRTSSLFDSLAHRWQLGKNTTLFLFLFCDKGLCSLVLLRLMQRPCFSFYFRWLSGLLKVWLFRPAGVLPQTGLKWAELVLNKSCLSLVQKYLKRCSRDRAALLLPVPLNRKGIANFKKKRKTKKKPNSNKTIHCLL